MKAENENKVVNFMKSSDQFQSACSNVPMPYGKKEIGIAPTKRQASKWLMKKGIAYKIHKGLV
jgi:hypothetical protein